MADTVVAASLTLDSKQADQSVASFKSELKKAQQEVINLTDKFGATSKAATDAAKRAAELKDRIGDAKKLVDSFNPDEKFRGFTQVLGGVAGGFAAITGAMGLLGVQSEDVQKQLLKVQSALAITQGLNSIGDSIQSFKNLGATLVQTLGKGGLIGVAIVGVGLLVAKFSGLFDAVSKQTEAQKALNDVNKEAAKDAVKQRVELDILVHSAQDVNLSVKDRLDKVKELQEKFPGYFEDIKTEKDLNDKLTVAYDAATKGILAKAHATAVFNKIVENENKALSIRTELEEAQTKLDDSNDKIAKARDSEQRGLEQFEQSRLKNKVQGLKDQLSALDEVNKALEKSIQQAGSTTDDAAREEAARKKREADAAAANKAFIATHTLVGGVWYTNEELKQATEDAKIRTQVAAGKITGKVGEPEERVKTQEEIDLEARLKANKDYVEGKKVLLTTSAEDEFIHTKDLEAQHRQRIAQQNVEFENRKQVAQAVSGLLTGAAELFGRQTVAGKALGIASATINTLVGVTETLRAKSVLPEPLGTIVKIASAATLLANGIATVKKIVAVQVPGGGGGGASPSVPSLNAPAPLAPQASVQTTRLDQQSLNATNNATVQAYVVESQGADAKERITRLNRAARLGG